MLATQWPVPFIITLGTCVGVGVVGVSIGVRMPNKVRELTDRCRLTIQRCKFIYKVWSKCRNKKNFDKLICKGGLDAAFSEGFMKCDPATIANRLKICGGNGIRCRAKTKLMRTSLIFLIGEIKKCFRRNTPQNQQKSLQKYSVNALQRIGFTIT